MEEDGTQSVHSWTTVVKLMNYYYCRNCTLGKCCTLCVREAIGKSEPESSYASGHEIVVYILGALGV